jgi:MYXO-CTERM domain-containing protein
MFTVVLAAVVGTLTFDGEVVDDGSDYAIVEFEVPEGVAEIEVDHVNLDDDNVLDWGVWAPTGFRGWGGGSKEPAVVGSAASSRGYLAGAIPSGTWRVVIGKASLDKPMAPYQITVTFRDEATISPTDNAAYEPVVLESSRRWYAGDFHVHSEHSGDATASFDGITSLARERGLDFVALTDHNTVAQHGAAAAHQSKTDDVLLIRGAEVTTYQGHANAFGTSEYIDHRIGMAGRTARDIVEDVVGSGGILSINHPALALGGLCIGCEWLHEDTPWANVAAIEIGTGSFEATGSLFTPRAIEIWDSVLDAGHRVAALGGSDDHDAGIDLASHESPIGSPTTMVLADELSERAILDAIVAGRTVVKLRGPDDPMIELTIRGADGEPVGLGETTAGAHAEIDVTVTGGDGLELSLVHSGESVDVVAIDSDEWSYTFRADIAETGDRFRAEVVLGSLPVTVTSHVWVDYLPEGEGCGCRVGDRQNPPWGALAVLVIGLAWLRRRPR